jgi:hypothetical protein
VRGEWAARATPSENQHAAAGEGPSHRRKTRPCSGGQPVEFKTWPAAALLNFAQPSGWRACGHSWANLMVEIGHLP